MSTPGQTEVTVPDARLVPAALTVWVGVAAGLLCSWWCTLLAGALGAVAGGLLCRRGHLAAGLALLGCALLTGGVLAAGVYAVQVHPLRSAARDGAPARLRVELSNRPKPLYTNGFGGQQSGVRTVLIEARALSATVRGKPSPADAAVLLFAPARPWGALLIGQQVTVNGKLAPARGGDTTVAVVRVRGPPEQLGPAGFGQRTAEDLRTGLRTASSGLDPDAAGLLPGLVDGDTSVLPHQLVTDFRTAGLSHLTAVSGANLAIIGGAVLLLLRAFRLGPRTCAVVAGAALFGFVLLAGPDPSVLRAAVMGAIGLAALALGRQRSTLPALAFAVIVLVAIDPAMAVNLGFALSVLATAGLVLLAPRLATRLAGKGVPMALAKAIAVPAAAQLVTAPLIAGISGQFSLVAVGANLLVAPVVAPATVCGVLAALSSPLGIGLAKVFVWLAAPEVDWIVRVGTVSADLPAATVPWPDGWIGAVSLAVLTVAVVVALRYRRSRILVLIVVLGVLVATVPTKVLAPGWPPTGWAMVSCDVGQGDGEVLSTAESGRAVVVDTGPDEDAIGDCLRRLGVRQIPLVVLSHLHADHIGGLRAVLAGRSVGAVAIGPARIPDWALRQVRAETAQAGVPLLELRPGERLSWPGLALDVLAPLPADVSTGSSRDEIDGTEINNTSLVLRASTAAGRVLLTGDVELQAQADLLSSGADLRADVLKIPHHGSRYSLPQFLDATGARIAIASVGVGNSYGHPNAMTLGRLAADRALVLRTDQDGDVAVLPGGPGPPRAVPRGDPRPKPQ